MATLNDTLLFFDQPSTNWALHRAALEGTLHTLNTSTTLARTHIRGPPSAPLLQALCCTTYGGGGGFSRDSGDATGGSSSSSSSSSGCSSGSTGSSSGGVKTEGVSDKAMRILLANGYFVEACQVMM